jgi:2-succinyl-6-hydroxy-2,4-cyclohexadiene-1-carboxylate synthase
VTHLVLVPGFTQTRSSWDRVVAALAAHGVDDVEAIDVPSAPTFASTAHTIGAGRNRAIYCGYSMGGRLCLRLSIDHPELVAGLILVSSTAGINDPSERAARIASDDELATFVEREGVEAFLERWLAQPLFAGVPADAPGLDDRRDLTVEFIAHGLRHLGAGTMDPMWDHLTQLQMPVGLIWGARDAKYRRLAQLMERAIPNSVPFEVSQSGHAIPLEQPAALATAIRGVLAYMPG